MIADLAIIGDGRTAAIVDRSACLRWLCWPRIDGPAFFASLLGTSENGMWEFTGPGLRAAGRSYRGTTLVLDTVLESDAGAVEVTDFIATGYGTSHVVRMLKGLRGSTQVGMVLRPCFDFGRIRPRWAARACDMIAVAGPTAIKLQCAGASVECTVGECRADMTIGAGQEVSFVLSCFASHLAPPQDIDPTAALRATSKHWCDWISRCTYHGPYLAAVQRSLITMKALVYEPSGGIAAAVTSSLPEEPGGERNWDYRYCWLRDATFTLMAFLHAGYHEEARNWRNWLVRSVAGEPSRLQPVYGLAGEPRLMEWQADWLCGYEGARPVRFGNDAFRQKQLDVYGEVIDALFQAHRAGLTLSAEDWAMLVQLLQHLESIWQEPDRGIWEIRGSPQHFTHSQVMFWAAFDRCIRIAEAENRPADLGRWRALRTKVHERVCEAALASGHFTQAFENRELDASLLLLAQVGFVPPRDPRLLKTLEAVEQKLCDRGFLRRYLTKAELEGVKGSEGAFLPCGFWYVDALVLAGEKEHAKEVFERLLEARNDLGHMSEEFDPHAGMMLGNFPQALSHMSLVTSACTLASDRGPAQLRST